MHAATIDTESGELYVLSGLTKERSSQQNTVKNGVCVCMYVRCGVYMYIYICVCSVCVCVRMYGVVCICIYIV